MNSVKIKKLLLKNLFEKRNPYANLVLDFTPNPKHQGTYTGTKIILRVGNFAGHEYEEIIGAVLWVILHESVHAAIDITAPELYKEGGGINWENYGDEWYQVAGMDYLEDFHHNPRLNRPMKESYSKLHPKAFEFRKTFDINFQ